MIPGSDTDAQTPDPTRDGRKPWAAPQLRRLDVGEAETGEMGGRPDGAMSSKS